MTSLGHCIVNICKALRSLPSLGQLVLINDLREFLDREEQRIRGRNDVHAICVASSTHDNVSFGKG
jgi:hypothetical protein